MQICEPLQSTYLQLTVHLLIFKMNNYKESIWFVDFALENIWILISSAAMCLWIHPWWSTAVKRLITTSLVVRGVKGLIKYP